LLAGDGLAFKPSGVIGSIAGALIVTGVWQWKRNKDAAAQRAAAKQAARSGRHR
jgi:hypothetical protein